MQALDHYKQYEQLYGEDMMSTIAKFQVTSPHFADYKIEMEQYEKLEAEIMALSPSRFLNPAIQLSIEPLKLALAVEAKAWKTAYGHGLNERYRISMENIVQFISDYSKRLNRPIKVSKQALHGS